MSAPTLPARVMGSAKTLFEDAGRSAGLIVVLAAATALRIGIQLARAPAVYQDSLIYLRLSRNAPFSFAPSRPNGYPLVLRTISLLGHSLGAVTAIQHMAGLAVAVLVYRLLRTHGVRRWLAVTAAGVVAVNARFVALEHSVLTETFFTLALFGSSYLLVTGDNPPDVALSGVLLAFAATVRTVALFAAPAWIVFAMWRRLPKRALVAGVGGLLVPLLAYCTVHAAHGRGFNLIEGDGWFLYGKVGPIVDCKGARPPKGTRALCVKPVSTDPNYYLYSSASPANQLFFGGNPADLDAPNGWTLTNSSLLRRFSLAVIWAHPASYARIVWQDLVNYFRPAQRPTELSMYGKPGSWILVYEQWGFVSSWLILTFFLTTLAAILFRRGSPGHKAAAVLGGMAVAVLVGTAATAGFNIRYLVPLVPLLASSAAMGAEALLAPVPTSAAG